MRITAAAASHQYHSKPKSILAASLFPREFPLDEDRIKNCVEVPVILV